ncbi:MAG TPA: hypothetical protein VID95_05800, partial [Candidatus Limnocylindrales bacterium]
MNRIDPSAAAELARANVQETLPSAGVQLRTIGDPQQPTFRKAVGQGFSDLMSARGRTMFAVVADCNAP